MFEVFDLSKHCLLEQPPDTDYVLVEGFSFNYNITTHPAFLRYDFVSGGLIIVDKDGGKLYGPTNSITGHSLAEYIRIAVNCDTIKFYVNQYNILIYLKLDVFEEGTYLPVANELLVDVNPTLAPVIAKNKKKIADDYSWPFNHKLYNYQQNNVKWLIRTEQRTDAGKNSISIPQLAKYNLKRIHKPTAEFLYNGYTKYVYPLDLLDDIETQKYHLTGGLLCDEVGLGKTFSAFALIMNTLDKELTFDLKKPTRKELAAREKELTIVENDKKHPKYLSRATLVFAPARLITQWNTEADKFLLPLHNVRKYMITTITQYKKTTPEILCNSDIVFVAYRFLTNSSYSAFTSVDGNWSLTDFHWKRIILDEGHEICCYKGYKYHDALIDNIKADYRWVFSGTPFADNYDNLNYYFSFLSGGKYDSDGEKWRHMAGKDIVKFLKSNTRANTYATVKDQIHIPPIIQKTVLLKQHQIERALYVNAAGNPTRMIQLCTNIMASGSDAGIIDTQGEVSLNEVREKMKKHFEAEIAEATKNLEMCRSEKAVSQQLFDNAGDHFQPNSEQWKNYRKMQKNTITAWKKQIKTHKNTIASMTCRKKLFEDIEEKIENDECPICYGDMNSAILTKCGHICCEECMKQIIADAPYNIRCPICRTTLQKIDIGYMHANEDDEEEDKESDYYKNVNKWGTKMAWLVQYLENLFESDKPRVIIFSQWKNVLRLVGKVLEEHNINKVYLQGTSAQMASSINKFKTNKKIRVIMLSSDTASSGSNLTEASHVILLDTVNGTAGKAKAIEDQAIGRANRLGQNKKVQVIRLIMKDTIEYDYYKENIDQEEVTEIEGGKDVLL